MIFVSGFAVVRFSLSCLCTILQTQFGISKLGKVGSCIQITANSETSKAEISKMATILSLKNEENSFRVELSQGMYIQTVQKPKFGQKLVVFGCWT